MMIDVEERRSRLIQRLLGFGLVLILLIGGFLGVASERAQAATDGPGITFEGIGHIGAFRLGNGTLTYCLEVGVYDPYGAQHAGQRVTSVPGYDLGYVVRPNIAFSGTVAAPTLQDPTVMRQINYAISVWGNTSDNSQAAATQLAVFMLRGSPSEYLDAVLAGIESRGGANVVTRARQIVADARANARAPRAGETPAAPTLHIDESGASGSVEYAAGTTRITLTNAIFSDSGDTSMQVSPTQGGTMMITPLRSAGWDHSFEVEATAEWETGREGWKNELTLYTPVTEGEQRIAAAVGESTDMTLNGTASARATASGKWWPEVSTEVSHKFVKIGETFADSVTVTANPSGSDWPMHIDGTYLPLTVEGTLYGPLLVDPTLSPKDDAPADAPVLDRVKITADRGPGTYAVESEKPAPDVGFYTWVWSINWESQDSAVTRPDQTGEPTLAASEFPVRDRFGETSETHVVKQGLTISTKLEHSVIGRGWSVTDEVYTEAPDRSHGTPADIPLHFRGTLYHSETKPERQEHAPDHAEKIGEVIHTSSGETRFTSDPVPVPLNFDGYVTMQWCVLAADQHDEVRALIDDTCDEYGIADETAEIQTPTITTIAQPTAQVGDPIRDTALVEGLVPNESTIEFTAYLKPVAGHKKYDDAWSERSDQATWTTEDIAALGDDRCTAQPVATTKRVVVSGPGTYLSPEVRAESSGTIYWVERLYSVDPVSGEEVLMHEGDCGLPNETTVIFPAVRTAPSLAHTGSAVPFEAGVGAGVVLLMIGAAVVWNQRRRQRTDVNG